MGTTDKSLVTEDSVAHRLRIEEKRPLHIVGSSGPICRGLVVELFRITCLLIQAIQPTEVTERS